MGIEWCADSNIDRLRLKEKGREPEWVSSTFASLSSDSTVGAVFDVPPGCKGYCYGFYANGTTKTNWRLTYFDENGEQVKKDLCYCATNGSICSTYESPIFTCYPHPDYSKIEVLKQMADGAVFLYGMCNDGTHLYATNASGGHSILKLRLGDLSYVSSACTFGFAPGHDILALPHGICTDNTYLYICDTRNDRIVKRLCSDLSYVSEIGTSGLGNNKFNYPRGICIDDAGNLYVDDSNNSRIVKRLSSDLSYVDEVSVFGSAYDTFSTPWGVCTDSTHIYVTDYGNHRVVKMKCSDLSYVKSVGTFGVNEDQYYYPHDAYYFNNKIYANSYYGIRVRNSSDLSLYASYEGKGSEDYQFDTAWSLMLYGDYIYVGDGVDRKLLKIPITMMPPVNHSIWMSTPNKIYYPKTALLMSYVEDR